MASEIDTGIELDFDREATVAREPRMPNAVWINRPSSPERGTRGVIVGAILVTALLALGMMLTRDGPLVSPAIASAGVESRGDGPTGCFPDMFERATGEIEPFPPTF